MVGRDNRQIRGEFNGIADEFSKERMGFIRFGMKLRMKLTPDKPRVIFELKNLDQIPLGTDTGNEESLLGKELSIFIVKFVAVSVPLQHDLLAIDPVGFGVAFEATGIRPQPHRPPQSLNMFLLLQKADNGV